MPRAKKQPKDWTTDEAMRRLFPRKVKEHAKDEAGKSSKTQVVNLTLVIKKDRT